ncbi:D-2-hydroxyacid dehydrogenase [Oceanospirillum sediminis]|uniref:D-2-hydroxyacid dehydrogenase n=1 Tax=Oceanospirillum sediminis TaxID=2760088 RepID=A0A839IQM4_9GAMM|nr:D-2-hydroxyacid dehydrogenase [Oceanospirillum sediminis]MBB1487010.1 D-2-hydroxyacid dehydrogenase [Oceanospirillum sediminis]
MALKGVLLDADSLGEDIDFSGLQAELDQLIIYDQTSPDQVTERIATADIVFSNKVPITRETLTATSDLKLICVLATGMNNIDLNAAAEQNIIVSNAIAYGTNSVAQHTLMLMLMLATQQARYSKSVHNGAWNNSPFFCLMDHPVIELAGKHLVITGSGVLGSKVAQLAEAFDMKVSFSARPGSEEQDSRPSLDALLPDADFLSLHCPLTPQTLNLLDKERLKKARPGLMVINCARGGIVNETDILQALRAGSISGYATDVLTEEPPRNGNILLDALQDDLNLIVTPHNAWITQAARQNIVNQAKQAVIRLKNA